MGRFYGVIGYASEPVETEPGVWEDVIVEQKLFGDVLSNSRRLEESDKVNSDISVGNRISVMADSKIPEDFQTIRYIKWGKNYWIVSEVEVQHPRLIFRLGGIYNGPKAQTP